MIINLHTPSNLIRLTSKNKNRVLRQRKFRKGTSRELDKNFSEQEQIRIVIEAQSSNLSIPKFCKREGITLSLFDSWTKKYLGTNINVEQSKNRAELSQEERFSYVIEARSGLKNVAEICRILDITHDDFLIWNSEFCSFNRAKLKNSSLVKNIEYNKNEIISYSNLKTFEYVQNYLDISDENLVYIEDIESLDKLEANNLKNVISFRKINDIRFINKFFEEINSRLAKGGVFVGCLETFTARMERKKVSSFSWINNLYFFVEFVLKRIIPKLSLTKKYYFDFTKGHDRLLSKAEGFGRLISAGFCIIDYKCIDGMIYFAVKKINEPSFDMNPSYGPIYKMPRVGKNGRIIKVYKFRTMHPYSEYLQDYLIRTNGYAENGKLADDFRVPRWGKFLRRFWLDELPQLINVFKGEMKLVGIRPVSKRYFQDIPSEMKKLRLSQKPGCIPPYVSLNRGSSVDSVLKSEMDYLKEKVKNPYTTDFKYFLKAIFNIVVRKKRSA